MIRRLLHRRCDETAQALAGRAEDAEADFENAEAEIDQVRHDLMCTEHDLEEAHERLRGLRGQFERVLEAAYASGALYRTWALLWDSLEEENRQVLDTAGWTARIPDLGALALVSPASGLWGSGGEPERCPDPFCQQASGLLVVRHHAAQERARMLCTECGRHWRPPRYLGEALDQGSVAGPAGDTVPVAELDPEVLAAADAALPPTPQVLVA